MTVKFTTIESTKTSKIELLFEFLDYELPEYIDFEYITKLGKTVFINNLQTNQIKGIYLQPIKLEAEFVGTYYSSKETSPDRKLITAKQRADQLGRLQGQLLKFFFDGFKQIVIIENFRMRVHNQEHVEVDMTLQPHDIMNAVAPSDTVKLEATTIELLSDDLNKETKEKVDADKPPSTFDEILTELEKPQERADIEAKRNQALNLNNSIKNATTQILTTTIDKNVIANALSLRSQGQKAYDTYIKRLDNGDKDAIDNISIDLQNIANKTELIKNVAIENFNTKHDSNYIQTGVNNVLHTVDQFIEGK